MAWTRITARRVAGAALLVCSFVCLYFGLYGALVHYEKYAPLDPNWFTTNATSHYAETGVVVVLNFLGNSTEIPIVPATTRSLVGDRGSDWGMLHLLWQRAEWGQSSYLPAGVLILFGIIIPACKLVAVLYWMLAPCPGGGTAVTVAARVARWTAVDAVAEAMIVALLCDAGVSAYHLEGFVCFVLYVLLSAISIWLMDIDDETRGLPLISRFVVGKYGGCPVGPICTLVTLVIFLVVLLLGSIGYPLARIYVPKAAVRNGLEYAIKPYEGLIKLANLDETLDRLLEETMPHLPLPDGQASVLGAVQILLTSGHFCSMAGAVLIFTAVLLAPLLEAVVGCLAAFESSSLAAKAEQAEKEEVPLLGVNDNGYFSGKPVTGAALPSATDGSSSGVDAKAVSHASPKILTAWDMIGDLSMLDVFVVGIATAAVVLSSLGDVLYTELLAGFHILIMASFLCYFHGTVCGAIICANEARSNQVAVRRAERQVELKRKAGEEQQKKSARSSMNLMSRAMSYLTCKRTN